MRSNRILVPISFSFSIRYIYRTGLLHKIREYATPVIALTWNEEGLINELRGEGFETHLIPESKMEDTYISWRAKIDYWFHSFRVKSESKRVQVKYLNQYVPAKILLRRQLREKYNVAKFLIPGYEKKVFYGEVNSVKTNTNYKEMLHLVEALKIDAVFTVTPFHFQEDILLRVCKDMGKQMITSILSFDNLTKRGWIPVEYDVYMVWNKYNYNEAISFYPTAANEKNVHIVGAAQFDFYYNDKYLLDKKSWLDLVGLPATEQPIILYGGGPQRLFPNEPQYLKHILEAVSNGTIKSNPLILFRCHPIDQVERWQQYIGEHPNLVYDTSWTGKQTLQSANITETDIQKLCSTLAHTDVHVNLCSTMTVDGSAYNKPQIGPCYDEVNPAKEHLLQNMYLQDHFQPIVKSNGLLLAKSKAQLIQYINDTLQNPQAYIANSKKTLEEIITYADGNGAERVSKIIRQSLLTANTEE